MEVGIVKLTELRGVETIGEIIQRLSALEAGLGGEHVPSASKSSPGSGSNSSSSGRNPSGQTSSGPRAAGGSFVATAASPAFEKPPTYQLEVDPEPSLPPAPVEVEVAPSLPSDAPAIERIKVVLENRRKMFLVTVLEAAQHTALEGEELFVEFAPESRHFRDMLTKPENIKILRDACQEITGKETGVRIAVKNTEAAAPTSTREDEEREEKQRLRQTAESNPVVQQMLRTFRGEIVDVRRIDGER